MITREQYYHINNHPVPEGEDPNEPGEMVINGACDPSLSADWVSADGTNSIKQGWWRKPPYE